MTETPDSISIRCPFSRKFKPIVEGWNNDEVGRIEIQTFAHKRNNRKNKSPGISAEFLGDPEDKGSGIFDLLMEISP